MAINGHITPDDAAKLQASALVAKRADQLAQLFWRVASQNQCTPQEIVAAALGVIVTCVANLPEGQRNPILVGIRQTIEEQVNGATVIHVPFGAKLPTEK